ncbi:MAG: hypothetical protein Q8S33_27015 [Myxococcales bacterium]|nr:hypothetical protein [Myxococcales bacterium]
MAPKRTLAPTVTLRASIKRGGVSDEYTPKMIPAELKKAFADLKAKRIDYDAAAAVAVKYLAANFLNENLPDGEVLFPGATEVWAQKVELAGMAIPERGRLPSITADARFKVKVGPKFPKNQDAMEAWEEDNTPLSDAVNFFWKFGDTALVIGEHEGAGAWLDAFPGKKAS